MTEDVVRDLTAALGRLNAALERPQVEGLDAAEAAAYCGVSISLWRSLDARGLCPAATLIGDGKCKRWGRTELSAWLEAGAPTRSEWNRRRDVVLRRRRAA